MVLRLIFIVLAFGALVPAVARLTVVVTNVRVGKGPVEIAVFHGRTNFFKAPAASQEAPATAETLELSFDIPDGDYAIALYQDLNRNHKLDRGLFSIPIEPFGFSNNFRPLFSAPTFDDCRFAVGGDTTVTIDLK
jgi:uncharacterized protein (DUF2141 family)